MADSRSRTRTVATDPAVEAHERIANQLRVEPGTKANLAGRDTGWTGGGEYAALSAEELDHTAKERLAQGIEKLIVISGHGPAQCVQTKAPSHAWPRS